MSRSAEISGTEKPQSPVSTTRMGLLRILIHCFVGFHLIAIMCWTLTSGLSKAPLSKMVRDKLEGYIVPLGLGQQWNMFAPHPPLSNDYLEAEVTFADGAVATWRFPRMEELGYFDRYRRERHRKWTTESVLAWGKSMPVVAEAAARFAAWQVERPGSPPRKVELVRYSSDIAHWRTRPLPPHSQRSKDWKRQLFFVCEFHTEGRISHRWPQTQAAATQPGEAKQSPASNTPADDLVPRQEGGL